MIGSALGRISTAERMSVDQLKEALQNKTLPAYIAVPLIEEKLNMNSRMQAMAAMQQAQQPQPPIADQVMQRASAESGINALPSNLPVARGAGGGIVAFAEGGDADEDDDDDDEDETSYGATRMDKENEALLMRLLASRRADPGIGAGMLGTGLTVPQARPDAGIEAIPTGATPAISLSSAKEERSIGLKAPSGHKYEDKIVNKAEEMGIDPKFALYLAGKETGGLKNPETAKSHAGALGIMQLMPGTAKDMGVKDPFDPDQNIAGGLRYAKLMMDKYKDPKLAAIAYNWGPGNTDKWLRAGADPDKLPKETKNYIASLKKGGAIRFQNEGLVNLGGVPLYESIDGAPTGVMQRKDLVEAMTLPELQEFNRSGLIPPRLRGAVGGRDIGKTPLFGDTTTRAEPAKFGIPPEKAKQVAADRSLQNEFVEQDRLEGLGETPASTAMAAAKAAADQKAAGEKAPSMQDKLEELLSRREKGLTSQREQDKYMALLAAGLGMMGGKSRYAAENIGQGALQGVASMQAANKLRAAEENALLSGRLGQYRVAQSESLRRDLREDELKRQYGAQISRDYNEAVKSALARRKVNAIEELTNPSDQQAVLREAQMSLMSNPGFQEAYKRVYGSEYALPSTGYRVIGPKKGV